MDFISRHLGPDEAERAMMLKAVGYDSVDALVDAALPTTTHGRRPTPRNAALPIPTTRKCRLTPWRYAIPTAGWYGNATWSTSWQIPSWTTGTLGAT